MPCCGRMPSSRSIGAVAGVLAFAAISTLPGTARAGASARLVYDRGPGAEGCAGEPALRAAVAARLGYDPFFPWAHDTVVAEIERTGDGFRARVRLVGEEAIERGAREIAVHNESCASLTEAMALTISLIIDPSRMTGGPPRGAPPADAATSDDATAVSAPPQSSAARPAPPPIAVDRRAIEGPDPGRPQAASHDTVTFEAGAQVLAVYAPAPLKVGPGVAASFGVIWRRLSLDFEGRYDFSVSDRAPSGPQAESWLASGQVVPCLHFSWAFGCAVLAAGALGAKGNVPDGTTQYAFWAGAGGRLGVQVSPFGDGFLLRAFVDVLGVSPTEPVTIDGVWVYQVPAIAGALGVGAVWRFP